MCIARTYQPHIIGLAIILLIVCNEIIWKTKLDRLYYGGAPSSPATRISSSSTESIVSPRVSSSFNTRKAKFAKLTNPPSNIYVLGERNSGTNYAAKVLRQAFNAPNIPHSAALTHEYFSADIPVLKHKHMFRHSQLNSTELHEIETRKDILWILVVRSPCDWAEAMKRLPWHVCMPGNIPKECPHDTFIGFEHKEDMKKYTLAQFFELEWGDWPESSNFRNLSFVGKDFIYKNIFQLRKHKLEIMKQIIDTVPRNVKIVRLHELERSPEILIQNLLLEFGNMTLKQDYKPQQPSNRIHKERCLSKDEWEIAQREIDWQMESYFGYTFLDCHLCYT